MADVNKLKSRRNALGAPPAIEDASPNLEAPETAPAQPAQQQAVYGRIGDGHIDGRTMRKSNRTEQFATRVTPEFNHQIRAIAMRDGLLLVEVLERALVTYEAARQKPAKR